MTWSAALAPLHNRNFAWYFASRFVNTLGNMMATIALAFAVLDITDSPTALGQVLAAHTIPMVALLLYGGVIADRFPRTLVLQASNLASAASQGAIALLVLTGQAELWMLVVLSAVHGAVSGVGFPAMASVLPQLVARSELQPANALVSLTRNAMMVLGPTAGALLVVTVGSGWALAVDAATWLLAALLLVPVTIPLRDAAERHPTPCGNCGRGGASSGRPRGCGWSWWASVCSTPSTLGRGSRWAPPWPTTRSVDRGGATSCPRRRRDCCSPRSCCSASGWSVRCCSACSASPCAHRPCSCSASRPPWSRLVTAAFLAGAGTEIFGMGWNLAMQENIEDRMLSRAYSYDALGSFVAIPIGQLAYGPLAEAFGFQAVLVASAVAYVAVVGLVLCSRVCAQPPAGTDRHRD